MPKVSVVLATFNRAHLLDRAIHSVLNQTFQDFELIVVDDGSKDDTQSVVSSFVGKGIKYVRNQKNMGPSAARNIGIKLALGEYIAFQDSDDLWMPQKLEKQIQYFEKAQPEVGVVHAGRYIINNNKIRYWPPNRLHPKEGDVFGKLIRVNFMSTPASLNKKECFLKAGLFNENLYAFVDWELFIRFSKYFRFGYINEPLMEVYKQPDSISKNLHVITQAYEKIVELYFEDIIGQGRDVLAAHYFRLGHLLCSQGKLNEGRCNFIKSIKTYPLGFKAPVAFFVSLFGENTFRIISETYRGIVRPF